MIKKYVIDVEVICIRIEEILNKYIDLPDNLLFIKNHREPITSKCNIDKYTKLKVISNKPWTPFIAPAVLRDYYTLYTMSLSDVGVLFTNNPLIDDSNRWVYDISRNIDIEDIILQYAPKITVTDMSIIVGLLEDSINILMEVVGTDFDCIYTFDISSSLFIINKGVTIQTYRFNEAVDYRKIHE